MKRNRYMYQGPRYHGRAQVGPEPYDLVIVHGLNGDPIGSWTYTHAEDKDAEVEVCWPRDLLPKVQPRIRVLSFGYSGDIYENNSVAGIRGNAKALLVHLKLRREDLDASRPVIFLGHCLGGLIVKQAMCYANNMSQFEMIASATRGLLFFGTPHFGADKNQWLSIAEALGQVSAKAKGRPSTLVEAMTQNSRGLTDISEDFVQIAPKYTIKTMYETQPLATTGRLVVPMMSTRMFGHKEDEVPIDADHISMCQFSDESDTDFFMVWNFIRKATEIEVSCPVPAAAPRRGPEAEGTGQPIQANQTLRIGNILGQPVYIDAPMRQRPPSSVATARNGTTVLSSIMSSHELRLLPAPAGCNLDTEAQEVAVPLAPLAPTPQLLHKDTSVRVVTVECESESPVKQPRWISRVMAGIRHKGGQRR
ncbi:hypothetical protein MFIFM68171_07344 [Madurella fahalii]|uniref:DUF676 domain-containing protein n=1 Tax=Madurella fahalii TaxID=1157608 RepID=A0ABQ0GHB5_9PEZI